jgi:trehalose utilization protein
VTVFCEDTRQPQQEAYERVYPQGIGVAIAQALRNRGLGVSNVYQSEPEHGLSQAVLEQTDVLIYWSHKSWRDVSPEAIQRTHEHVLAGMGFIALHSALVAPIFRRLMGTTATMRWRNVGERERLWVIDRTHPIVQGIGDSIELEAEEMYSEDFDIPTPDDLVFISWFEGGEVFRSGCCWKRGRGRVFYFRPGHETAPTFHHEKVQRVLYNAVLWAAPTGERLVRANQRAALSPEAPFGGRIHS